MNGLGVKERLGCLSLNKHKEFFLIVPSPPLHWSLQLKNTSALAGLQPALLLSVHQGKTHNIYISIAYPDEKWFCAFSERWESAVANRQEIYRFSMEDSGPALSGVGSSN
ncbi:MAG: hypothetical protein H6577_12335 [Lewinellaceae bacterium]|nr:hypothetical protein [Lewinellaceae bacterium]